MQRMDHYVHYFDMGSPSAILKFNGRLTTAFPDLCINPAHLISTVLDVYTVAPTHMPEHHKFALATWPVSSDFWNLLWHCIEKNWIIYRNNYIIIILCRKVSIHTLSWVEAYWRNNLRNWCSLITAISKLIFGWQIISMISYSWVVVSSPPLSWLLFSESKSTSTSSTWCFEIFFVE